MSIQSVVASRIFSTKSISDRSLQLDSHGTFAPHDVIDSDEPQLESYYHFQQLALLFKCLNWLWQDRNDYFAGANLTIYYSPNQKKSEDFRGPDFFVVLGTEKRPRRSWVVWNENDQYPNIIVELLSDSTAKTDRGFKKTLYSEVFQTPNYFWFDPESYEFAGFQLVDGAYEAIEPNESGHLWSDQLGLFLGVYKKNLRFFWPDGVMVPTPEEYGDEVLAESNFQRKQAESRQQEIKLVQQRAELERQRAEAERQNTELERQRAEAEKQNAEAERQRAELEGQRAEAERQRADRLAAKLRALGIEPDEETI